ncbi:regulator of G- signaling 20, partial [Brachionus plicatilis]
KKAELVELNIEKSRLNDCIKIAESIVDFALNRQNQAIGSGSSYFKQASNQLNMSTHSNRENSSNAEPSTATNRNQSRQQQLDTPPNSPDSSDHGSKACCFCWCCCCSCSCLTVRSDETRSSNSIDIRNASNIEPPTLEEIKSWSDSFDKLMQSLAGRFYFREFLRSEYSEENMLFWMACEELKTEQQNPQIVEEKARLIYEDYISILSPKEVSLDSRVREIINRNMVDPSPYTFDEAQLQIYTLMHRDSYPRFLNSPIYKKLCAGETRL